MKNTANCHQIAIRIEKQNSKLSLSTKWNYSGQFTFRFHIHPNHHTAHQLRQKMKMNLNVNFQIKTIMLTKLFKSKILKTIKKISISILFLN